MGADESTLNCCARTRGADISASPLNTGSDVDNGSHVGGFDALEHVAMTAAAREGYLIKSGPGKPKKPRYFRLKSDLFYFGTKEDMTPKGVAVLTRYDKLPQAVPFTDTDDKHFIKLSYAAITFFRAESGDEAERWYKATTAALESSSQARAQGEPSDFPVSIEGFLERRSSGTEWKTYWIVLRGVWLLYYVNQQDTQPKGIINLDSPLIRAHAMRPPHNNCLVRLRHEKTALLGAESAEDMGEWLLALQTAIAQQQQQDDKLSKPVGWKRTGKIREAIIPLIDLLRDPLRVEYFREFVKEMGCEHCLLFWLDVQQFKRLCKKEDKYYLKPCAVVIYTKYIRDHGAMQVDLPNDIRERTLALLDDPSMNTFRDSQNHIFVVLRDEYYPLFLTSRQCVTMAESLFLQ